MEAQWAAVRQTISAADVRMLLATPLVLTWQEWPWPVCCDRFMAYVGEWSRKDFMAAAPDGDGLALFRKMAPPEEVCLWDTDVLDHGGALLSVCTRCQRRQVHLDFT